MINDFDQFPLRNSEIILHNELFKSDDLTIYLNKKLLPNYLCQLQNLNINYDSQNDLNLLKKFKHLKCLTINCLDEDFVFPFLPFLEELHISNSNLNKLTLKKLQKQLKTLTLNDCSLIDSYIDYLNNLQEFTVLNCKDITCWQKFVGNCLQNFTNLTKLKEESLDENRDITKYIENLINLKYLDIYECGNTEIKNSNFIKKLTNLEYLAVKVRKIIPEDFYNLKQLKYLKINHYDSSFTNLESLTELNITRWWDDDIVESSLNFPKLEKLTINLDEMHDKYLQNLNTLKELHILGSSFISGKCFLNFNLEKLTIKSNYLVDSNYFVNFKNLKSLNITRCEGLNLEFWKYLPKLESLTINSTEIYDKHLETLQNLKYLEIIFLESINGNCLLNLTKLESLIIYNMKVLKDEYLINLHNLKLLRFEYCNDIITGVCFYNLKNLTDLTIKHSQFINDSHLQNLQNLKKLTIVNCENIYGKCFNNFTKLKELTICNCNQNFETKYFNALKNLTYLKIENSTHVVKKGDFLLFMNKLNRFEDGRLSWLNKCDIDWMKERIRKGETLEQICDDLLD
ncbi:hypothetical protein ABK040_013154 [Willaertia magna]